MNIIKKQGLGTWITLGTIIVFVISLIMYGAALGAGMDLDTSSNNQAFYSAGRPEEVAMMATVTTCGILALVFLVAAIVLSQFKFEGILGTVCDFVCGALRVVSPALIFVALFYFVYGSFTGLGWTFFSNEDLVIYDEAVAVGKQVITGLIFFGIAGLASIIASFFAMVKKEA